MEAEQNPVKPGKILSGSLFNEPMLVVTLHPVGADSWELGLVGLQTQLRSVPLTLEQIATLRRRNAAPSYAGDCELVRLGLQAYAAGSARGPVSADSRKPLQADADGAEAVLTDRAQQMILQVTGAHPSGVVIAQDPFDVSGLPGCGPRPC